VKLGHEELFESVIIPILWLLVGF